MFETTRQFIEEHIDLIDANKYAELYKLALEDRDIFMCSQLTSALNKAKINPLDFMDEIPPMYNYFNNINEFIIPDHIVKIGRGAFALTRLKTITIPKSVVEIESQAFGSCSYLESVYIENADCQVNSSAFQGCSYPEIFIDKATSLIHAVRKPFSKS